MIDIKIYGHDSKSNVLLDYPNPYVSGQLVIIKTKYPGKDWIDRV